MKGPSIPPKEAEELFRALRADEAGESEPMDLWDREIRPGWLRNFGQWCPRWLEAEDLLQDLLLDAQRLIRDGKLVGSPGGLLSTMALRRIQKSMRSRETGIQRIACWAPNCVMDHKARPADEAISRIEAHSIVMALRRLPPPWGYILYARLALSKSYSEIGKELSARYAEHGPVVGIARLAQIETEARGMLRAHLQGADLKVESPGRFNPETNAWVGRILPPIGN